MISMPSREAVNTRPKIIGFGLTRFVIKPKSQLSNETWGGCCTSTLAQTFIKLEDLGPIYNFFRAGGQGSKK